MSEKEQLLLNWEREHTITLRVLKAYPESQQDLKPHEKSKSAKDLAWNFVIEQGATRSALEGRLDFSKMPSAPAALPEVIAAYERSFRELKKTLEQIPDTDLNKTIQFPIGPGKMGDVPVKDLCWMMLMDKIHHRGQFSVYLRLAGGKVPSIYGPTADEPWM